MFRFIALTLALGLACNLSLAEEISHYTGGNRLAYLDEINPYYPHRDFAKLITPQWVGEEGVEAVIILSIDDMRDTGRYENYLRPILDRLKQVKNSDGLSRMSIFTNSVNPKDEQLQKWLKEGVSFEVHTITHPCPCLGVPKGATGDIEKAKQTYDGCVDMLFAIPNYKGPVAYRMPCCDSMNSVSPRFFAEVMNKTTKNGNFLSIDSSVFNIFTSDDPALPRELVQNKDGSERFAPYAAFPGFVNTIENYPYPYVIGNMIWQFPCVVPSDWEAQHRQGVNNPKTVEDMKAALDCTVIKQGTFTLVFHPHGWIKAEQIVELIDHAEKTHGKKVKFLSFREAMGRLNEHMLAGTPIRDEQGINPSVRVLDLDDDGFVDAVVEDAKQKLTRVWNASKSSWHVVPQDFPVLSHQDEGRRRPAIWGTELERGVRGPFPAGAMPQENVESPHSVFNIEKSRWDNPYYGVFSDAVVLRRAIDSVDFVCMTIIQYEDGRTVIQDGAQRRSFLKYALPRPVRIARDMNGADAGLRLIDLNGDRKLDVVYSNADRIDVYLHVDGLVGWDRKVISGKRGELPQEQQLPPIIRADGTNNGFFVKGDALYWQNEDTGAKEAHHVKKITFAEVLAWADEKKGADAAPGNAKPQATGQSRFTTAHRTPPKPRSPQASLAAIKVRPGFRVELVAAEPLTMDPVAFDWGPDGRLWIVEMADYPDGLDGKGKPGGRVVYLEDTDADGKYDKRTVFLDGIPFPTGVMVWKKGVLVTAAPDIFYAEDTNGDGKADKRETLFTGFGEGNQQHRVNGLRWGLDGWIYLGNGDSGGNVRNVSAEAPPGRVRADGDAEARALPGGAQVNVNGRDLRIRQKSDGTWEMDPQSGQTQFGRDRDDFGNWFGCNNPNPGWHYALEDHYLRRNPHVAPPNPRIDLTADRRVFPISTVFSPSIENHKVTPGGTANHSSVNSICIYRDNLYGEHFYGNAFISEPVHNLIRRMVLRREGVSFRAERAPGEEASEFLASSDPCFRPNMIRTGPDGCLWFADMVRQTIEHPKWIPPAWQATLNLREGDDKGRIYRIVEVRSELRAAVRMDKLVSKGLVAAMDSPNGWQRDMAQMMLLWRTAGAEERVKQEGLRQDLAVMQYGTDGWKRKFVELQQHMKVQGVTGELTKLASEAKSTAVRVQALCALDTLGLLLPEALIKAVSDPHPVMRQQAARIAWDSVGRGIAHLDGPIPELREALLKLAVDPSPQVRQQLAYTLGDWPEEVEFQELQVVRSTPDDAAGNTLASILLRDPNDPYITAAALSSIGANVGDVLRAVLTSDADIAVRTRLAEPLVATAIGRNELGAIGGVLEFLATPTDGRYEPWQLASLARLLDALAAKKITLDKLRESASPKVIAAIDRLPGLVTRLKQTAADRTLSPELRTAAISLFFRLGDDERMNTFASVLVDLQSPPAVQEAAASAMAKLNTDAARSQLLAGWSAYSPALRSVIMDELLRSDRGAAALVSALEAQVITRHEIDAARRQPLLAHKSDAIRTRAEKLLGGPVTSNRQALVERYEKALALTGDATRGAQVFTKNCAACHKLGNTGNAVGPDLARINDRSGQALVTAVLDPNRAVEAKYVNYLLAMRDGEKFTGIITTETGTSITINGIDGKARTVLRKDLESLRSLGLSLMPEGLEQAIDEQAMADLVAFVASQGQPAKQFENNTPRKITADDKGTLTLPAAAAEVYGPSLIFEQQYRNLGWWSSDQDHAVWTIEVTKAGKYDVSFDYALGNPTNTNTFQLLIADQKLTGPVPTTGSWDKYVTKTIGTIELMPGTHRLTFRSQGPVKGALIDLRTIVLKSSRN